MDKVEYKIFKTGYCLQNEIFAIIKGKNNQSKNRNISNIKDIMMIKNFILLLEITSFILS